MKLTLPVASVAEVAMLADALDAAARAHRQAGIGAAEAIEADRADGELIAAGAADLVLATLARAGVLERLATAARTAHDTAGPVTTAGVAPSTASPPAVTCPIAGCPNPAELGKVCAAHLAMAQAATPLFLPAGEAPPEGASPTLAGPAAMDPENELVDIFAPGAIT